MKVLKDKFSQSGNQLKHNFLDFPYLQTYSLDHGRTFIFIFREWRRVNRAKIIRSICAGKDKVNELSKKRIVFASHCLLLYYLCNINNCKTIENTDKYTLIVSESDTNN